MSVVRESMADNLKAYFSRLEKAVPLSREEEAALADRVKAGDQEAVDLLVKANLRFVVHIAAKYEHLLDLPELISAGNVGLVIAAKRFDKKKKCKFITYAVWWVRQSIQSAIATQSRLVRLPENQINKLGAMKKRARQLQAGAEMEELSEVLAEEMDMPVTDLRLVLQADKACCSLDESPSEWDDRRLMDTIPDTGQELPDAAAMRNSDREAIFRAMDCLNEREQAILRLYFGLDDSHPMTLEAIGAEHKITRERVRQIRDGALTKLRQLWRKPAMQELREHWQNEDPFTLSV